MIPFSIAVCTYKRPEILKRCLDALVSIVPEEEGNEVMIIDNDLSSEIQNIVSSYLRNDFHYVPSEQLGLSFSRNLGLQKAKNDWVIFLDDDAFVNKSFLVEPRKFIDRFPEVGCFGGEIHSVFDTRPWYVPKLLGSKFFIKDEIFSSLPHQIMGGLMAIRKSAIGGLGFNEAVGMKGSKTGYGAETEFINRIILSGVPAGHCKNWNTDHLMRSDKLNWPWLMQSFRSRAEAISSIKNLSVSSSFFIFLRILMGLFFIMPIKSFVQSFRSIDEAHHYSFNYLSNLLISYEALKVSMKSSYKKNDYK